MIGAVWIRWIYFQSSAARRSVGVSPFFGSWSRTQCGPAPHSPPHPRLFSLLVKTGFVAMVTTECAILGMAVEKRHKLLSFSGMVGEERHKALLVLLFNVYFTGGELSALPVTPSEGPSQGVWMLAEAYRAAARSLRRYSWSLNAIGVFWQCTPQTMTQPIMIMHSALAFHRGTGGAAWRMQMQAVVGQRSGDPAHQSQAAGVGNTRRRAFKGAGGLGRERAARR
eukprot:COSAG02_NODE_2342_length_9101_cov_78.830038_10_plen_225_part_00